ncbi:MAG: gliding motility-associated C-terminal domain-containing protein [Bacteroidota bacterium]
MWCQCPMYVCNDLTVTFQIILNETTNIIETHISNKPICETPEFQGKATLGILNESVTFSKGCVASPYKSNSLWKANKEAWRFVPNVTQTIYTPDSIIDYNLISITPDDKIEYRWYEGSSTEPFSWDSTVVVTPNETTMYKVTAVLCSGETFSGTITVTVVPPIPNAFTPNGDGENDTFEIMGLPSSAITNYNIKIYNRWGQMVFNTNDINLSWNGKTNNTGELCTEGVYVWIIYYYDKENKIEFSNKGTVTLLR